LCTPETLTRTVPFPEERVVCCIFRNKESRDLLGAAPRLMFVRFLFVSFLTEFDLHSERVVCCIFRNKESRDLLGAAPRLMFVRFLFVSFLTEFDLHSSEKWQPRQPFGSQILSLGLPSCHDPF